MDPLKQPAPPAIEYVVAAPAIEYVVAAEQLVDRLAQILAEQSAAVAVACEMMTTEQAAEYLSLKPETLCTWRWSKGQHGPPFCKISHRIVRYRKTDLDAWLDRQVPAQFREAS